MNQLNPEMKVDLKAYPLDQEHTDEIVPLARFVDWYTRETREQNLIDCVVIQNLV